MESLTETPAADRPFYKRLTVIGGFLLSVMSYLESQDLIPTGTAEHVASLVEHISALLIGFGVYRHIPTT